ncbi:hypothetical protein JTB14_024697 [Gonioctena quinquepunctata]|nr:hypothetical protein JTB14_024697 [Gonioctena quinquepunctata]
MESHLKPPKPKVPDKSVPTRGRAQDRKFKDNKPGPLGKVNRIRSGARSSGSSRGSSRSSSAETRKRPNTQTSQIPTRRETPSRNSQSSENDSDNSRSTKHCVKMVKNSENVKENMETQSVSVHISQTKMDDVHTSTTPEQSPPAKKPKQTEKEDNEKEGKETIILPAQPHIVIVPPGPLADSLLQQSESETTLPPPVDDEGKQDPTLPPPETEEEYRTATPPPPADAQSTSKHVSADIEQILLTPLGVKERIARARAEQISPEVEASLSSESWNELADSDKSIQNLKELLNNTFDYSSDSDYEDISKVALKLLSKQPCKECEIISNLSFVIGPDKFEEFGIGRRRGRRPLAPATNLIAWCCTICDTMQETAITLDDTEVDKLSEKVFNKIQAQRREQEEAQFDDPEDAQEAAQEGAQEDAQVDLQEKDAQEDSHQEDAQEDAWKKDAQLDDERQATEHHGEKQEVENIPSPENILSPEVPFLDTFQDANDLLPANEGAKEQKDMVSIESQHPSEYKGINLPLSHISPTSSTLREDKNGETKILNAKNNVLHEKTSSQEIPEIHHTFRQTSDVPKNGVYKKSDHSLDVEKAQFLHTCENTCTDLPLDPLPSSHKGGTNLNSPPNALIEESKENEKNQPKNHMSPNFNAETGEVGKTEPPENQKIEVPKNILGNTGVNIGAIGSHLKSSIIGKQMEDPTKILGSFQAQPFPDTGISPAEGLSFATPYYSNYSFGVEYDYNRDLANKPLRFMEAGFVPGSDKHIVFESVTIKEADKKSYVEFREAEIIPKENITINSEGKYSLKLSEVAKEHEVRENHESEYTIESLANVAGKMAAIPNINFDSDSEEEDKEQQHIVEAVVHNAARNLNDSESDDEPMDTEQTQADIIVHKDAKGGIPEANNQTPTQLDEEELTKLEELLHLDRETVEDIRTTLAKEKRFLEEKEAKRKEHFDRKKLERKNKQENVQITPQRENKQENVQITPQKKLLGKRPSITDASTVEESMIPDKNTRTEPRTLERNAPLDTDKFESSYHLENRLDELQKRIHDRALELTENTMKNYEILNPNLKG